MRCETHHVSDAPFCLRCVLDRVKAGTLANGDLPALIATIEAQSKRISELERVLALADKIASQDKEGTL